MSNTSFTRGGHRPNAGRKAYEGSRRIYVVADDVHEWISKHGGGKYITDIMRVIMATQPRPKTED